MLDNILSKTTNFESVSLDDLDEVALQNRLDAKYVISVEQLHVLLNCINDDYFILDIDGLRVFSYNNNYFDTSDFLFFKDHHNGYAHRIKVRSRKYMESNLSFFEIKKKEKVDRTNKLRTKTPDILTVISKSEEVQIQSLSRKKISDLALVLKNNFNRITLVNSSFTERVTIDTNLSYQNTKSKFIFSKAVVIEIKREKGSRASILEQYLKNNRIRSQSFSKYVFGVMHLYPGIKKNNFLPILRQLKSNNIDEYLRVSF